jgi:nucleotide-binding universal stress UspA family protein
MDFMAYSQLLLLIVVKDVMMKRILVPCDFSICAQNAYTFALDLAKKANSEVFVLKAIDFPFMYENSLAGSPFVFDPRALVTELEGDAISSFKKMKAAHSVQHDVSFEVIQGPVTPTIRSFINKHNIDLVVMGTRGASGLSGLFVGSNTEKIVRLSPVPVLAVRRAVNLSSIQNIVFPTDLELDHPPLISRLKELQAFFNATIHVLVVNTPHNMKRSFGEEERMQDYVRRLGLKDFTLNIGEAFTEEGGIADFVRQVRGDMIAMATHGRRGLSHLFYGSIAEDIVNHLEVPIWTYSIRA